MKFRLFKNAHEDILSLWVEKFFTRQTRMVRVWHNNKERRRKMKKIMLAMFLMLVGLAGCQFDTTGPNVSVPTSNVVNFRQLDNDCDGFISMGFVEACETLTKNQTDRDACLSEVEGELSISSTVQGLMSDDCDDDPSDDPAVCATCTNCGQPGCSACAKCINPGAVEVCDGVDNQCDGQVDEGITCDCLSNDDCNDDTFCNGVETCNDTTHTCESGSNPCSDGLYCDEDANECVGCMENSQCDDDVYCNGAEVCDGDTHTCKAGTLPCGDDLVCDEDGDQCVECLKAADCDDGTFCNGAEVCDGDTHTCKAGNPPCNGDLVCDEDADSCVGCLSDDDCGDGVYCNGVETCNMVTLTCEAGSDPCDDGLVCDEDGSQCVQCLSNDDCNDDLWCDGVETCNMVTLTCESGDNACGQGQYCDEDGDSCLGCVVDDDCDSSRPDDLSSDYLWGCSTATVAPHDVHMCTSCLDSDHDGYCAAEICDNSLDDDGDGVVDESDCEPADICDLYGAEIRNISGSSLDFYYHTYILPGWLLDIPADHLEPPLQNFGPMTLAAGASFGADCLMGIDAIPMAYDAWMALTPIQKQQACVATFACKNWAREDVPPMLNQVDEDDPSFTACLCAYNATPAP